MSGPWSAQTTCPQCAAEVVLDAGDPVFACRYCRTRLYIASRGPLCYRLPPNEREGPSDSVVYLPFWRFRGIRYRVLDTSERVQGGLLDATVPASSRAPPGLSLGIRPQVVSLTLDRGEIASVPVDRTAAESVLQAEDRVEALHGSEPLFTRLVGEMACVVTAPYALERAGRRWQLREILLDGLTHALTRDQAEGLRSSLVRAARPPGVTFLPLLCPECGRDLPAASGAVALLCGHCTRAWWVQGTRFSPMLYTLRPAEGAGARFFPFWQLSFKVRGLPVSNRAELRRWAISYQPVPPGWEREPCQLFVPGFKLGPGTFLRLARVMSLAPLEIPRETRLPPSPFDAEPVRLPLKEAAQALKVILAGLASSNRRGCAALPRVRVQVRRARLVYLPYHYRGSEWIEEQTGTAIQASSVEHGLRL